MKLSDDNINTLMLFLQQKIEECSEFTSEQINLGKPIDFITYPPNGGLTDNEQKALGEIKNNTNLKSALRKVFADNSANILFEFFNLIDGTSDPNADLGKWTEISFIDKTDVIPGNNEMFHDLLYSKYWEWKKIRPVKSWSLDNLD